MAAEWKMKVKKMILVTSPPACGKTYISKQLAKNLKHVVYLDKDTLIPLSNRVFAAAGEEINRSSDFFEKNIRNYEYETIVDLGLEALDYDDIVLINAPFTREVHDEAFLERRVRAAWQYLKDTVDTSSCRVIFGEADFLPGLVVDKFADVLVAESLALGIDRLKQTILDILVKVLAEDGVAIRGVYERSDAKVRLKEGMERVKGFLSEPFDPVVEIVENGIRYQVDVAEGQKTGFFLDQKYNRLAIQPLAKGGRALDCFTHTGAFALNAAKGGAAEVIGVDASQLGVDQAAKNAALNGMEDRVRFVCRDVFELLPELHRQGEQFDLVVLDPPAFTKSRASVKKAVTGYREINLRGIKLVKNGGYLATCSCSHFMTPELFTKTIGEAARDARRRLRQVEYRTQSADHPILWGADESYYLKFYIFQVCDDM